MKKTIIPIDGVLGEGLHDTLPISGREVLLRKDKGKVFLFSDGFFGMSKETEIKVPSQTRGFLRAWCEICLAISAVGKQCYIPFHWGSNTMAMTDPETLASRIIGSSRQHNTYIWHESDSEETLEGFSVLSTIRRAVCLPYATLRNNTSLLENADFLPIKLISREDAPITHNIPDKLKFCWFLNSDGLTNKNRYGQVVQFSFT